MLRKPARVSAYLHPDDYLRRLEAAVTQAHALRRELQKRPRLRPNEVAALDALNEALRALNAAEVARGNA